MGQKRKILCLSLALLLLWQLTSVTTAAAVEDETGVVRITGINILRPAGKAVVSFNAGGHGALLVLALYTPSLQMEDALTAQVSGEGLAEFNFSQGFPEEEGQFHLHAMLVDLESYAPLCPAYTNYSENLTPTVDDFDPDLVLNFDGQKEENFAVVAKGVTMLHVGQDFSGFTTEDEISFTLYDVPSGISNGLRSGDRVVLFNGAESYPVAVANVEDNGAGTVTLRGKQPSEEDGGGLNIADFFDYITIDRAVDQVDQENMEYAEGVQPAEPSAQLMAGGEASVVFPYLMGFELDADIKNVHLDGTINANLTLRLIFLFNKDEQLRPHCFYEISMVNRVELEVKLVGRLNNDQDDDDFEIKLAEIRIPIPEVPIAGFVISLGVPIKVEIEGGMVLKTRMTSQWTMTGYDGREPAVTQNTVDEDPSIELQVGALLDVGMRFRVAFELLKLFYIEGVAQVGREIRAVLSNTDSTPVNGVWHLCERCAQGTDTVYFKTWFEIGGKVLFVDYVLFRAEYEKPIVKKEFYVSFDGSGFKFGWGSCNNKAYLTDVKLKDTSNKSQVTGQVSTSGGESERHYNGNLYLPQGTYQISADAGGYQTGSTSYEVKIPGTANVFLDPLDKGISPGSMIEGWINPDCYFTYSDGHLVVTDIGFDYSAVLEELKTSNKQYYVINLSEFQEKGLLVNGNYYYAKDYSDSIFPGDMPWTLETKESPVRVYASDIRSIEFNVDFTTERFANNFAFFMEGAPNLESVTFNKPVENLWSAFKDCPNLAEIIGIEQVRNIGDYAFQRTGLREIDLSNITFYTESFAECTNLIRVKLGNGKVWTGAFDGCHNLQWVDFGQVNEIQAKAFRNCISLESVDLPGSLSGGYGIGDGAFRNCTKLESVAIPGNIICGPGIFEGCTNLQTVQMRPSELSGQQVWTISQRMFKDCYSLEEFEVPWGIGRIDSYAFQNCLRLKRVTIPLTVSVISENSFIDCPSLREIDYGGTIMDWNNCVYGDIATYPIRVHCTDGDITV